MTDKPKSRPKPLPPPRWITEHLVEADAPENQIRIAAADAPGSGGACHRYVISGYDAVENPSRRWQDEKLALTIIFQNGPIGEGEPNGVTQEALLAVVIDRLRAFQNGLFPSEDNRRALEAAETALHWLHNRTKDRLERGVEGTLQA